MRKKLEYYIINTIYLFFYVAAFMLVLISLLKHIFKVL